MLKSCVVSPCPIRKAINYLDYVDRETRWKNSLESYRCADQPARLMMLNIPNCREEIMQTATEIPITLGSHSWGKRKGLKMPQEPQVISFVRNFAFSDHREKAFRSVDSEKAREKGKLYT